MCRINVYVLIEVIVSLQGSYICGECQKGYVGNQSMGCHNSPGLCPDGTRCDANAHCVLQSSHYNCQVGVLCSTLRYHT
jgi:syndecan 4